MPVALWLVLAQVSYAPSSGPAHFPSLGTWSPPPLGRVSAAYDDGGWAVVWADQRRFPGQTTTFSDVWVVAPTADGGLRRFEANSLSTAVRDDAVIATNGSAWLVAWSELDGGYWLKGRTSFNTNFNNGWQGETTIASPVAFDHGTDLVAGRGGEWRMVWRKGGAIWVQYGALGSTLTTVPSLLEVGLVDVPGDFLLAYLAPNLVFTYAVGTMGSMPFSSAVSQPRHISLSGQTPQVIHQTSAGDLSFFTRGTSSLTPLPALTIAGTNPAVPLLSTALQSGTLIAYQDLNGANLRLVTGTNAGTPVVYSPTGAPVALVSEPTRQLALLVEQDGGTVWSRTASYSFSSALPGATLPIALHALPGPQLRPTVAWSETKQAFLVMWDEFVPPNGGLTMSSYLLLDGGTTSPQPYGDIVDGGTRPRLTSGTAGQLLGLLRNAGLQYFETLNETTAMLASNSTVSVPGNLSLVARGTTTFGWGPSAAPLVQLFTNGVSRGSISSVMPRCAALKAGEFWLGQMNETAPSTTVAIVPDTTGGMARLGTQPDLRGKGQHCYAVRPVHGTVVVGYNDVDGGIRLVTVEAPFVDVVPPQPGSGSPLVTPLGTSLLVSWVEPPLAVRGFIVGADGGVTPLTIDDNAVDGREHWAAPSPNGSAAVVWQSFDVASGRVLVNARIVSEPTPTASTDAGVRVDAGVDAGVFDGGSIDAGLGTDAGSDVDGGVSPDDGGAGDAGAPDASVEDAGVGDAGLQDAGAGDAGVGDAGVGDAGLQDAGAGDAGAMDAGAFDAGATPVPIEEPTFVPVCGCNGTTGAPLLLLAVMLISRRRRAPSL